jgi:hypothetical protein
MFLNTHSQQWQWAKGMGNGTGIDVKTDLLGNVYELATAGTTYGSTSLTCGNAGVIAKHDSLGNLIWTRGINFSATSLSLDGSGNLYISGAIGSSITVCGGGNPDIIIVPQNGTDVCLCKYDNNGNLIWVKGWDNNSCPVDKPTNSKTDEYGNTYIAGRSFKNDNSDHFILKYDAQGVLLWTTSNNFNGDMVTYGMDVDIKGNLYIGGAFFYSANFNNISLSSNSISLFIAKYSSNGQVIWAKKDGTGFDECYGLCLDKNGGLMITGKHGSQSVFSGTTLTQAGMFVAKYDTSGSGIWVKSCQANHGRVITCDTAGNCFIAGNFSGSVFFGNNFNLSTQKPLEIYVAKYSNNGNFKWAICPNSSSGSVNNAYGIASDLKNSILVTGIFSNNSTFSPYTLNGDGIFLARLKDTLSQILTDIKPSDNFLELKVYPNPVKNIVSVSYSKGNNIKDVMLSIKDVTGRMIYCDFFTGSRSIDADVSGLTNGLYFYTLYVNGTAVDSKKLVLSK